MVFRPTADRRRICRLRADPAREPRIGSSPNGLEKIRLDAEIEVQRTSNEVAAKDHKAQNVCMIIATTAYSILPIIGFGSAIVCVAL